MSIKIVFEFYGTVKTIMAASMTEANGIINDLTDKANRACVWYNCTGKNDEGKNIWVPIGRNRFFKENMMQLFKLFPDVGDENIAVATMINGKKVITEYAIKSFAEQDYRIYKDSGKPVYMTKNGAVDKQDNCLKV